MTQALPTRRFAAADLTLPALGLGCMGMSDFYGQHDPALSHATIDAAVAAGITLLDTGDLYGQGANELLLREALQRHRRQDLFIAVKFGAMRDPAGRFIGVDARPQAVKNFLAYSLKRLGTDYVDLYQPARLDPTVPVEDTVGAIKEMIDQGFVRHLGLSEAGADSLKRAHAVHPVTWLQIEYSLISRGIEQEILPTARALGIGITAYGVLSRGLISGHWQPDRSLGARDFRSHLPRFSGENLQQNLELVAALEQVAKARGASVAQIAIAWVLAQGPDILPLIGARTPQRLAEALPAASLHLTPADLAAIEAAMPAEAAAGTRYDPQHMASLDSERR